MHNSLETFDPEVHALIAEETQRQREGIELIASENFTSSAVMECLGSTLTNKYSEGRPGRRYYGGNEVIDKIERLAEARALRAFGLDVIYSRNICDSDSGEVLWGVNVQPYSGSVANFAAYTAVLQPGDTILSLDLPSGGHLSHGYSTPKAKISATSIYFNVIPYHVNSEGFIDMDEVMALALEHQPKLIIVGASAYPRDYDYQGFRDAADSVGALLMADVAHTAGLIAGHQLVSPFDYADIVTTTTHKTLRGPRAAMIFFRTDKISRKKMNDAVFPKMQGGPHQNKIAGIATQMLEVHSSEYCDWAAQVIKNAKALATELKNRGYWLSTDGTDNHLLLVSLKNFGITGSKMEKVCEHVGISLNKNTLAGDKNPLNPSGIRIGTPCITTRGMTQDQMGLIAHWLHRCTLAAQRIQEQYGKKLKDFCPAIENDEDLIKLKAEIREYASKLPFY